MTQDTRTAAAFMAIGLNSPERPLSVDTVIDHWDAGFLELIQAVTNYAPYADALAQAGFAATGDYPGVFDYEVSEEFGTWYAARIMEQEPGGHEPDPELCRLHLRDLAVEFFRDGGLPPDELVSALNSVNPEAP